MTDTEFDILDELYFVTAFPDLVHNVNLPETKVAEALAELIKNGLVKCFYPDPDSEADFEPETFWENFRHYYFLATKAGLLAHNSR